MFVRGFGYPAQFPAIFVAKAPNQVHDRRLFVPGLAGKVQISEKMMVGDIVERAIGRS
jgi:hypothetical protein